MSEVVEGVLVSVQQVASSVICEDRLLHFAATRLKKAKYVYRELFLFWIFSLFTPQSLPFHKFRYTAFYMYTYITPSLYGICKVSECTSRTI